MLIVCLVVCTFWALSLVVPTGLYVRDAAHRLAGRAALRRPLPISKHR